jgi:hypothetical protein
MKRLACALGLVLLAASPAAAAPWRLSVAPDQALLTRADGSGEDAATALRCVPGSGRIVVVMFTQRRLADHLMGAAWVDRAGRSAPWTASLTAASGELAANFPAIANPDEMNGGTEIKAVVPADAPVMAAFAKTGALRFTALGETARDPKVPAAKAAGLIKACGK